MARVLCTLPNASDTINGVRFTADRGQMVSDEISDAQAAAFTAIPGYQLVPAKAPPAPPPPSPKPAKS